MATSTPNQAGRILISGAGIAGPVAGYWLAQAGYSVTIVEHAPSIRTSGQSIDVRGHALTVLQSMGLEEEVRSRTTHEKGLRFIDDHGTTKAEFPVDPDGPSFTADIEIQRGDLAEILYDATRDKIEYIFNESISSISEDGHGTTLEFTSGLQRRTVDLLVIADGISSRTREIAFPDLPSSTVQNLGQWSAWFTIPRLQNDDGWARWYNAPKGRMILVRPDTSQQKSRVSLWIITTSDLESTLVKSQNTENQKQLWTSLFTDADWSETPHILQGMMSSSDFYAQKVAQVKMPRWSTSSTVALGDAAYCPSPISGMGTTLAITGAYILAGEIARNRPDIPSGLAWYETRMRPFVKTAQELFPGTPWLANPQTRLGIWLLHLLLAFVAWMDWARVLGARYSPAADAIELPEYAFSWGFFRGKTATATARRREEGVGT
ncbi:hypothetical protein PV11_09652 [Exophiala sideris]|uniref:FAD-binding domain-containing protein n=1 Tax=Exophiala sideris TaxID=1016849 RepID=A0A0D1YAK6_9EURO|nr:hypothetical protein PV11_09652 [Exophiala sideris]